MAEQIDSNTLVSHTDAKGRTLSGMGADVDQLAETMERHAPPPTEKTPEPAVPAGTETVAPTAPESGAPAPVSRGRQRYSDLTKERDAAKAERDAAQAEKAQLARERDELRQRLEAGVTSRREPEPKEPAPPTEPQYTRPEPTEDEIGTKYKTYAEFARDLAKWVVEQERTELAKSYEQTVRDVLERERYRDSFQISVQTSQERARKAYPDFDALLQGPVGQIPMATTRDEAIERVAFIAKHPQSEHIQYAILKDAKLAEQIRDSDGYTFGTIIAGLVPRESPKAPAWTPPPQPHPTVGASSPTTATPSSELAKKGHDFDSSGYRERRAAELGRKKSRW